MAVNIACGILALCQLFKDDLW